jgi:hypothetical protein
MTSIVQLFETHFFGKRTKNYSVSKIFPNPEIYEKLEKGAKFFDELSGDAYKKERGYKKNGEKIGRHIEVIDYSGKINYIRISIFDSECLRVFDLTLKPLRSTEAEIVPGRTILGMGTNDTDDYISHIHFTDGTFVEGDEAKTLVKHL